MSTIEQALTVLAARTAGGHSNFQGFDIDLGHSLAARVDAGLQLTARQQAAAYRLLRKYGDQLAALGIGEVQAPAGVEAIAPTELPSSGVMVVCQGAVIVVRGTRYEDRGLLGSVPNAKWNKSHQCWTYPATPTTAATLLDRIRGLRPEVSDGVARLVAEAEDLKEHAAVKDAEDLPPIPGEVMPSWLHQRRAYYFAEKLPGAILHLGLGTGKTKVSIDLIRNSGARKVLIVCPEAVVGVWPKQFRIHGGGGSDGWHIVNGIKTSKTGKRSFMTVTERTRVYDEAVNDCRCGKAHVVVSNYAACAHEPFASWSLEQQWDFFIADEAHRLKSVGGTWSKWAAKMYKNTRRRLALTGTLLAQTPLDAFSVYRMVAPDVFGKSFISHERRYAIKGGYEGREFLGMNPATIDEFSERLHSCMVVCGEEVLDLPEILPDITYSCQLGPAGRKAYDQMDTELFALLQVMDEVEAVQAQNVLVKMLRLQQICGGAVHAESGNYVEVDTSKAALLGEVLTDIPSDEPAVVFCRFIHDLDAVQRIATKMGRSYAELSGRRNDALTADSTLAEGVQIAAVQIQAGGSGVDMTRSRHAIYYSLGFSLSDYTQSRARLHRPGQQHHVRFIHLTVENSIDEDVYEALADRKSIVEYAIAERKKRG